MASTPQSHGLPSPPARSPRIYRSIRHTFVPNLPKLGTAKHRLRYNVIGILVYLFIWWQRSIYASAKGAMTLCLATIFTNNPFIQVISSIENVIFYVLAWNIIEAIYVIHVASPPAPLSSTPIQPQTSRNRSLRSNPMRYSSSPFQADMSLSASLPSFLDSSSALSTPTRVPNRSPASLRYPKQLNGESLRWSVGSTDEVPVAAFSHSVFNESPHMSHIGRKSLRNGRAPDSRTRETLLDSAN